MLYYSFDTQVEENFQFLSNFGTSELNDIQTSFIGYSGYGGYGKSFSKISALVKLLQKTDLQAWISENRPAI